MPRIAVVMPTYNGARFVGEAVLSVVRQTEPDWALTVVDDGSMDGGAGAAEVERVAGLPEAAGRVRLVRAEKNTGIAGARNRGYSESVKPAGGTPPEYVLFLDHDDLMEPDALAVLRAAAEAAPSCAGAHGVCTPVTADGLPHEGLTWLADYQQERVTLGRGWGVRPLAPHEPTDGLAFALRNLIVTPGLVLMRRAGYEAVGGFDPDLVPADDYALWLRLTHRAGALAFVPRPVLRYRLHDTNASGRTDAMRAAEHRVWHGTVADPSLTAAQRSALRRAYRATNLRQGLDRLGLTAAHLRRGSVRPGAQELLRAGRRLGRALAGSPA